MTESKNPAPPPAAYPDPELVGGAIRNAAAAGAPVAVGDYGLARLIPERWEAVTVDEREYEMYPRERHGVFRFVDVDSFGAYVKRYKGDDSLAYAVDVPDAAELLLRSQHTAFVVVLDDYPASAATSNRCHRATLELCPSPAARRWGGVLGCTINQEQLLDLVVDGVSEIVDPDAGVLHDLASNLHAIRSVEVESVIRTGGEGSIAVSENVKLKAGAARTFTFPEKLSVAFTPFNREHYGLAFDIRVKAMVTGKQVCFQLSAPTLGDRLITVINGYAFEVETATEGLKPMWRPHAGLNTASSAPYDI